MEWVSIRQLMLQMFLRHANCVQSATVPLHTVLNPGTGLRHWPPEAHMNPKNLEVECAPDEYPKCS